MTGRDPGTEYRNRTLLPLVSASYLIFGVGLGGFQLKLADIAREFNMHYTAMGSLVTMLYIAIMIAPVFSGYLSDRFGKKKFMALAFAIYIAGGALAALTHNVVILYIGIFCIGAGAGMIECIGTAALSDSHPEKAEKNINLSESFYSGGAAIGPFVIAAMISAGAGWRALFIVPAILIVFLLPLLRITEFTVREPVGGHELERQSLFSLLKSKLLMLLVICIMIYVGVETVIAYFIDSFFSVELGGQAFSAAAISLYWLAMTVSRILFGLINTNTHIVLMVTYGLTAVLLALLALSGHAVAALVICIILGFVLGSIWPMLMALATKRFSASSGTVAGILVAGSGLGGMLFPILMGIVADNSGLRWAMSMLVLISVVAFVCCVIIFRGREQR